MNVLRSLRNPAHTGDQRCVPCTIVNAVLLWLVVNAVVLLGWPVVGGAILLAGGLAIWLRGYLVPYTPRFAPRLVAASPIPDTWFHERREPGSIAGETGDGDELLAALHDAGVLDVDDERVYLDREFEERWHDEMDALADRSLDGLADELASVDGVPSPRAVVDDGREWISVEGRESLLARHVAVAELGAARALAECVDDPERRLLMARPLREFLSECPVCDTPFERSSEVSCCGGHRNPREEPRETLACPTCDQRFLVLPEAE